MSRTVKDSVFSSKASRRDDLEVARVIERMEVDQDEKSDSFGVVDVPRCLAWLPRENIGIGVIDKKFIKQRIVGKGGTATVYAAKSRTMNHLCAIKVVSRQKYAVEDFNTEATLLYNLRDEDGIIQMHNCAIDNDNLYLITELAQCDLMAKVNEGKVKGLAENVAKWIAKTLAETISSLHSRNIVHRDLKLENIVFTSADPNCPKLIDFAQAVIFKNDKQMFDKLTGTVYYLSPERFSPHSAAQLKKSEVWALGIIVYEMVFGHRAFQGKSIEDVKEKILKGICVPPGRAASSQCFDFLRRTLAIDWETRMSMDEVLSHPWISSAKAPL